MKKFEVGQLVQINRGSAKGNAGKVVGMNDKTGTVEIDLENGTRIFQANGNVIWAKEKQYEPVAAVAEPEEFEDEDEDDEGDEDEAPVKKASNTKIQPKPCQCGCGHLAARKRMFLPGHDQRHKGNLIRDMQAGSEKAEKELRDRKWRTPAEIVELKSKAKKSVDLSNLAEVELPE